MKRCRCADTRYPDYQQYWECVSAWVCVCVSATWVGFSYSLCVIEWCVLVTVDNMMVGWITAVFGIRLAWKTFYRMKNRVAVSWRSTPEQHRRTIQPVSKTLEMAIFACFMLFNFYFSSLTELIKLASFPGIICALLLKRKEGRSQKSKGLILFSNLILFLGCLNFQPNQAMKFRCFSKW